MRQSKGMGAAWGLFSWRTGGSEKRYAFRSFTSASVMRVKDVYGKTGK
jgi:hypothetical protein